MFKRTVSTLQPEFVPVSGAGGGKAAVHLRPEHYANLLLGFAASANIAPAPGTSSAPLNPADAARLFSAFEFYRRGEPREPSIPGTLHQVLTIIIDGDQNPVVKTSDGVYPVPSVVLCLNPPFAQLLWLDENTHRIVRTENYGPPVGKEYSVAPSGIVRKTEIDKSMLILANKLWCETPGATHENAASLAGPAASTRA